MAKPSLSALDDSGRSPETGDYDEPPHTTLNWNNIAILATAAITAVMVASAGWLSVYLK